MKKLQIIRVDNDLVQKANLQIGNNFIGRGVATGCNDDEAFKHAVIINLSPSDEMTITPVAPCYMKPTGCTQWKSLKLGDSVPIKLGDVCSLLPDKCWFKVISAAMEENNQTLKRKADKDLNIETDNKKACLSSSIEAIISPSETLNILNDKDLPAGYRNSSINGTGEHRDATPPVLQEIYSASVPEGSDISATCSKISDSRDVTKEVSIEQESDRKQESNNINLIKEVAANESEERINLDRGTPFGDRNDDQISSAVQESQSAVATHQDRTSVPTPETCSAPKREKCIYSTRCYRKNRNHKNNYSHPGDADYEDEDDDREECPYGIKCYRKNPRHKAQFKHTSVPRRHRRTVQSMAVDVTARTEASSAEESVDESDYEPSVHTESSDTRSDWDDSDSEWEDGTTG